MERRLQAGGAKNHRLTESHPKPEKRFRFWCVRDPARKRIAIAAPQLDFLQDEIAQEMVRHAKKVLRPAPVDEEEYEAG